MPYVALVLIGLVAGVAAGMFGIGGGLIIVPALMLVLKARPLEAIGTSLAALIPPVGLLGALEYYRSGHMRLAWAALIALGLFAGAFFGARIMISLPEVMVRRVYALFLLAMSLRMLIMGR
ncbi:MAG: sulfite exporter TauE/SafE family protein [Bryobacterales bacterium]|nr:sulfite exporter TauE/SafE family protein [Bryobacteraceae bacterium]MDW8131182.1 sulfite exporter TauE/SafE family protein [Bryobacterales bacterium]